MLKNESGKGRVLDYLRTASQVAPSSLPDIVVLNTVDLPQVARAALVVPLGGRISTSLVKDLLPAAQSAGSVDDQLVGVPFEMEVEHLVYNTNKLTATPVTWTDVISSNTTYAFSAKGRNGLVNDAFLIQYLALGASLQDEEGLPWVDEQALRAVLDYYHQENLMFKRFVKALFALGTICGLSASHASAISFLSIEGVTGPGDVGTDPVDSGFSWIAHRYPAASDPHIWQLAAGSDGGIVLGQAQPGRGAITEVRPMYNINSWLYSVGPGVIFGSNSALDFSTMHLKWGDNDLQFGISPGFDSLIPLVSDISQLTDSENGYVVYGDGKYDLIYHDAGLCDGCVVTLHLHGMAMAVPEPDSSLLWLLGLASVSVRLFTRKKS